MNKLFMTLVLLLSMAFGSLFYLAKCGHGGDAFVGGFAGGTLGGVIGSSIANSNNRSESREVEVVERSSGVSASRIADIEDELGNLRKKIRSLEARVEELEAAK